MKLTLLTLVAALSLSPLLASAQTQCPDWLNHSFRQLHTDNTINLCQQFGNKPLLIVNTASHCGFTGQFSGLEKIHQRYKAEGLSVIGFASDDFNQAAKSEAEAAHICYENYGVSFTMMAPISVKGKNAHPLFQHLADKTQAPSWNFTKYLVSNNGQAIERFNTVTSPDSKILNQAIQSAVQH